MKNFKVVTYYEELEIEDGVTYGCGDYHYINVLDADTQKVVARFGDHYHDKGQDKLEGFWIGLEYSGIEFQCSFSDEQA